MRKMVAAALCVLTSALAHSSSCIVSGTVDRFPVHSAESPLPSEQPSPTIVVANGTAAEGTSSGLLNFVTRILHLFIR